MYCYTTSSISFLYPYCQDGSGKASVNVHMDVRNKTSTPPLKINFSYNMLFLGVLFSMS